MNVDSGACVMRYRAFISYSHADEAWARWLMRRLETYRVPPRLVGHDGIDGPIGARLGAFFRDRDELTASSDLGSTIRSALAESAALIVLCSPAAAASRWVGAEVQAFRDSGRGDRILAFVVDGDPGQAAGEQACFPPSLIAPGEDGQPAEPLAADARAVADGRERAFLKLIAGLLGVGFDQLAQREAQRKQRKLAQVAMASFAGMAIALGLAATAYVARNDAQRRQAQAEDILGFMLGDLREKLTTVGRLDLMRAVDDKAAAYFASLDPRDLSDRALEEQARSLTGIGQVRLDEGNHTEAMAAFREAHARSTALHEREPDNGQRLYDLAQADFWIGFVAWQQGRLDDAGVWLHRYRDSAIRLAAMDPGNFEWQQEVASGHHNLAVLDESRGRYVEAEHAMRQVLALRRAWSQARPRDTEVRRSVANTESWLGSLSARQGKLADAEDFFVEQVRMISLNSAEEPLHARWQEEKTNALILLAQAQMQRGRLAQARANIAAAQPLAAALARQDPSNNVWQLNSGICHWWLAQLAAAAREPDAQRLADSATSIFAQAHATEPKNGSVLRWLAKARHLQAQLALTRGDVAVAQTHVAEALALLEPAWDVAPNEMLRLILANNRLLAGEIMHAAGDRDAAMTAWHRAEQLLLADTGSELPFERLEQLVRALHFVDRPEEAAPHQQRLVAAGHVPLSPWPTPLAVAAH
jgi:eukaryotic-like serine/threonine-protein kinase